MLEDRSCSVMSYSTRFSGFVWVAGNGLEKRVEDLFVTCPSEAESPALWVIPGGDSGRLYLTLCV